MERIRKQVEFIREIDKLKKIVRRNYLSDGSRVENDAEHSWYFAVIAMLLCEHARDGIDLLRVLRMSLIHDIVEIDAGDTLIYDMEARKDQAEREERAARRLFGMLPGGQAEEMLALWREFEAGETAEARYARAVDRFSAIVLNHAAQGKAWKEHGIRAGQIMEVNRRIDLGSPALWDFTREMIEEAIREGFLDV